MQDFDLIAEAVGATLRSMLKAVLLATALVIPGGLAGFALGAVWTAKVGARLHAANPTTEICGLFAIPYLAIGTMGGVIVSLVAFSGLQWLRRPSEASRAPDRMSPDFPLDAGDVTRQP